MDGTKRFCKEDVYPFILQVRRVEQLLTAAIIVETVGDKSTSRKLSRVFVLGVMRMPMCRAHLQGTEMTI